MRRELPLRNCRCVIAAAILALLPLAAASDVALIGDRPSANRHGWVSQWLGIYVRKPFPVNGRPTYAKSDDTGKVMWSLASGEWRVGREQDVKTGRGLFSVRQRDALVPDLVTSTWQVATEGYGWTDAPGLACVPAPPPFVYLYGHAPSSNWPLRGWVSTWLGAYALQPELMNGRPVYGRDDALLHTSQRLWFTYTDATRGYWFFGPASGLGGSLGWLSAFDTSLAPPHSSWSTASEEDKVAWVPAPGLRVSANRSDAAGWFRSSVTAAAAPGLEASGSRRTLLLLLLPLADCADAVLAAADGARRWLLPVQALGSQCVEVMAEVLQGHAQLGGARVQAFLRERCGPHCLMLTYVLLSALLLLGLYLLRRRHAEQPAQRGLASAHRSERHSSARSAGLLLGPVCGFALRARVESTGRPELSERRAGAPVSACQVSRSRTVPAQVQRWEEAEYELDSEMSEAESSEEKRLAFACLAGAIEEVSAATSAPSRQPWPERSAARPRSGTRPLERPL